MPREKRRLGRTSQLSARGNTSRLKQSSVAKFGNYNLFDEGHEPFIRSLEESTRQLH